MVLCTEEEQCKESAKGQPSAKQEERPQKKLILPVPYSWTFSLRTMEKKILLFKLSSLLYYAMAALANEYRHI